MLRNVINAHNAIQMPPIPVSINFPEEARCDLGPSVIPIVESWLRMRTAAHKPTSQAAQRWPVKTPTAVTVKIAKRPRVK
jgi:hypothetical protein